MRIHVLGVSGTGMGSLAGLLARRGHEVTGSDIAFNPPIGPLLCAWGVRTFEGYHPERIHAGLDLVIIGNVCRANNPEATRAFELGLATTHIAGALRRFALEGTCPLVVAGTHGKTTTSSLCAWLLEQAGLAPGFFIGGVPLNFGAGFRAVEESALTRGAHPAPPFVLEGDEYDTAFFEKTAKFLHYGAAHAVLTSVEHDHIDIYPTWESYRAAFGAFIAQLPAAGVLVANADDTAVRALVSEHARCRVSWYSTAPNAGPGPTAHHVEWTIANLEEQATSQRFDIIARGSSVGRVELPLSGLHNVANALAAVAICVDAYACTPEGVIAALSTFRGTKRRQEVLAAVHGITVYDDFAHHPSAVRTTLQGLKARHPSGRLAAVFEARSATACRRLHQEAYAAAFDAADLVLFAPISRQEIPVEERLDLAQLSQALRGRSIEAQAHSESLAIADHLRAWARPGDVIALLSNGSLGGLHATLVSVLAEGG